MSFIEKRQHQRFDALSRQEAVIVKYGGSQRPARLVNFSLVGALVEFTDSDCDLDVGSPVSVFFENGSYLFNVQAAVVRTTARQVAVQFCGLTVADEHQIKRKIIRMQILASGLSNETDEGSAGFTGDYELYESRR